jgi:hypothetical protein
LNLGLRWQLFTPIYEIGNRETNVQELTGAIQLAGVNGVSRAMYNEYNGIANFLPRIGLAWNPLRNTVLRAALSRSSFSEGTANTTAWPPMLHGTPTYLAILAAPTAFRRIRSRSTRALRGSAPRERAPSRT